MWKEIKPSFGDHIRVCIGLYYHHGIYASDECVIHYASAEQTNRIDPSEAKIIITDLNRFLMGGNLEVRIFDLEESKNKRTPSEIINYALLQVGMRKGAYNLISNNCEHFANECVFGKAVSNQVEDVFSMFLGGIRR